MSRGGKLLSSGFFGMQKNIIGDVPKAMNGTPRRPTSRVLEAGAPFVL